MSIQSEINRLKQAVSDAFTAIGNKGGTVPSSKVSGNLASAIDSIPEGVELNFEVVGGTTQPSNSKENTIWVKTEKIGAWYFSTTQPEGLQELDVWIAVEPSSDFEFNALKKNAIQVCPAYVKQYVNSALTDVPAKIHKDGAWVVLETKKYVFKSGFGFNANVYKKLATNSSLSSSNYTVLNYSVSSDKTTLNLNSYANGNDYCPVAFDIDLSKFNTMYIDAAVSKSNGSDSAFAVNVLSEGTSNLGSNPIGTQINPSKDGVRQTFNYNVKSITTTKRVCISTWNGRKTKIYNIWFE